MDSDTADDGTAYEGTAGNAPARPTAGHVPSGLRAWLVYTGLRLLLFVATAVVVRLVTGLNGFPLLLVALLVSSVAGLFLLRSQRDDLVAAQLARRRAIAELRANRRKRLDEEPSA